MKRSEGESNPPKSDTDRLVKLAQEGDTGAFTELMRRYDRIIHRTAYSILNNLADAEDAAQDTYLRVFLKLRTFQGSSQFSTWLTRIVINVSLMRLRRSRSRPTHSLDELTAGDLSSIKGLADSRFDPEDIFCTSDLRARLHQAVGDLPEQLREITFDQLYADLSIKELAAKRGLSIAAAKSRAHRARKMLMHTLARPRGRSHLIAANVTRTCLHVSPKSKCSRMEAEAGFNQDSMSGDTSVSS